eukprot:7351332-Pyramimonas_sp.AAC.1
MKHETIDLQTVMEHNMDCPTWDPAKETLQEHLDRIKIETDTAAGIPAGQEDDWDLLQEHYSLEYWIAMVCQLLDKSEKEMRNKNMRA